MKISINVANKIARADNPPSIVCGNSDYTIAFDFDSEWAEYTVKTARFAYTVCGQLKRYIDVVFSGAECNVPVLSNIDEVEVGVYAGDLRTTTPAIIPCERSILCGGGAHDDPPEDVYNQIMEQLKEFEIVSIVTELPTVGVANKTYFVPKTDGAGNDLYDEYMWINGAWEYIGTKQIEIDLTDYVKNTDYASVGTYGLVKTTSSNDDGVLLNNGVMSVSPATTATIDGRKTKRPITPTNLDYAVKIGITTNTETLTDEEKAAACAWAGAVQRVIPTIPKVYGENAGYGAYMYSVSANADKWSLAERGAGGVLAVGTPTADEHATTKAYVDGLIADLEAQIEELKNT